MQKYEEVEKVSEANGTEAVVSTMYNSLSKFVLLRINLVDFYTALSGLSIYFLWNIITSDNLVKEWKAFEEFVFPEYISLVKAESMFDLGLLVYVLII